MAAVIRSTPRQAVSRPEARMVLLGAPGDDAPRTVVCCVVMLFLFPWIPMDTAGTFPQAALARASPAVHGTKAREISRLPSPVLTGAGSRVCGFPHSQRSEALPCRSSMMLHGHSRDETGRAVHFTL